MTQKQFWLLALSCNIAFLFLYIFKQSALIGVRQSIQKTEHLIAQLEQQKKELYNNLQKQQQHASIKKRAEKDLGMRKAKLEHITTLRPTEPSTTTPTETTSNIPATPEAPV